MPGVSNLIVKPVAYTALFIFDIHDWIQEVRSSDTQDVKLENIIGWYRSFGSQQPPARLKDSQLGTHNLQPIEVCEYLEQKVDASFPILASHTQYGAEAWRGKHNIHIYDEKGRRVERRITISYNYDHP